VDAHQTSNPVATEPVSDARKERELTDRVAQRQQALAALTDADTVLEEKQGRDARTTAASSGNSTSM
jgi:hypothetical protein